MTQNLQKFDISCLFCDFNGTRAISIFYKDTEILRRIANHLDDSKLHEEQIDEQETQSAFEEDVWRIYYQICTHNRTVEKLHSDCEQTSQ